MTRNGAPSKSTAAKACDSAALLHTGLCPAMDAAKSDACGSENADCKISNEFIVEEFNSNLIKFCVMKLYRNKAFTIDTAFRQSNQNEMKTPPAGLEPATHGLTVRCSTD